MERGLKGILDGRDGMGTAVEEKGDDLKEPLLTGKMKCCPLVMTIDMNCCATLDQQRHNVSETVEASQVESGIIILRLL
jgi:hypothetical protein